jgi:hypothetical protein
MQALVNSIYDDHVALLIDQAINHLAQPRLSDAARRVRRAARVRGR